MKIEAIQKKVIKKFKYGYVERLRKIIYKNRKLNKHFLNKI